MGDLMIYRYLPADVVYRQDDDGSETIESKIVPFNEWLEVDSIFEGNFMERFAPGSLKKTFKENLNRIRVYFEHGFSKVYDSQPIAEVLRAWEEPDAGWFRASLLDGLPELLLSGIRRGQYGASIGARIVKVETNDSPKPSVYNPKGLEERTYTEVQAHDFSITPRPAYGSTSVSMRSITDELAIEKLIQNPERLLQLIRSAQVEAPEEEPEAEPAEEAEEAEPEHSEPGPPEEPEEPEASRPTQPVPDYLAEEEEESWTV